MEGAGSVVALGHGTLAESNSWFSPDGAAGTFAASNGAVIRVIEGQITGSAAAEGGAIHASSEVLNVKFAAVPEPGVVALFAIGVPLVLWGAVRRRA